MYHINSIQIHTTNFTSWFKMYGRIPGGSIFVYSARLVDLEYLMPKESSEGYNSTTSSKFSAVVNAWKKLEEFL